MNTDLLTLSSPPSVSNINFYHFNKLFYSQIRNEITEKRLDFLHEIALEIKEPEIFGTFLSSEHYVQTLKLLHLSTQATKYRRFFFTKFLPTILENHEKMLDVGCAEGRETKLFTKFFKEIVAVDIDKNKLNLFKTLNLRNCQINLINMDILNFEFGYLGYDLILFSHSLYYINEKKWIPLLKSAYNSLKLGGIITIIISCNKDKKNIAEYFQGNYLSTYDIIENIYKNFSNSHINCIFSDEIFSSKYVIDMMHICNMHVKDANTKCSKNDLIVYIKENLLKENGRYEFHTDQIFLIIKKCF